MKINILGFASKLIEKKLTKTNLFIDMMNVPKGLTIGNTKLF